MKHLIVGDIHGYHNNLRKFLLHNEVIDKTGSAINRDEFKVYSAGDLIDGNVNRAGDILNLEYAEEWFDAIVLGNHEFAFMGGNEFGSRRKHDRKTMQLLLNLIDQGIYVPSTLVNGHLLVHGGLSYEFDFTTAEDANEYINVMWKMSTDLDDEPAIFDKPKTYTYNSPADGIFELEWVDKRNHNFPQVVGHSTYYTGPILKEYDNGITHYNVDVGGKTGKCVGGLILDDVTNEVTVTFWGERYEDGYTKTKKTIPPVGDIMTSPPAPKVEVVAKKESKKENLLQLTTGGGMTKVNLVDLDDLDLAIINDPEILEVFKEEVSRGNDDLRLTDFFPAVVMQ